MCDVCSKTVHTFIFSTHFFCLSNQADLVVYRALTMFHFHLNPNQQQQGVTSISEKSLWHKTCGYWSNVHPFQPKFHSRNYIRRLKQIRYSIRNCTVKRPSIWQASKDHSRVKVLVLSRFFPPECHKKCYDFSSWPGNYGRFCGSYTLHHTPQCTRKNN